MRKRNVGNIVIAALVVINIALWLIFTPANDGSRPNFSRQLLAEVIGSTALVCLACALFLSTRLRFLEPYFGGLDQIYRSHKKVAMLAMFLLVFHFFAAPLNASHVKPGTPLGIIAFLGLWTLVLLTIAPRIPLIGGVTRFAYHRWRRSHSLIGIFFIIGFAHAMLVDPLLRRTTVPFFYAQLFFFVGAVAYFYTVLLAPAFKKTYAYSADAIRKLSGTTVELTLKPKREKAPFAAGQFAFVRFEADRVLSEPHPFTIASAPHEDRLRLVVKASGDWTQYLIERLTPGTLARVDGAYGMFNYKTGGKRQIWISGGIGLTPFLSWIRDFNRQLEYEIDFYGCMRVPEDGLFLDEVQQAAAQHANFRPHICHSNTDGRLSAEKVMASSGPVTDKEIYMCGPIAMVNALQKGFMKLGVPAAHIHFEEFNFR